MKTANTIKQLNIFFQKITKTNNNYIEKIEYEDWLYLKSATKNINNIITKLLTKSCAVWASDFFLLSVKMKKKSLIETVSTTDANKNGCDIVMAEKNVRIEIKSTKPVNEGNKYSSIQKWSILNDAIKLKEGDHDNNFVKIIGLLDLGERTDDAVNTICKKTNSRTQSELRKKQNNIVSYLEKLEENIAVSAGDNSKIYLKKFKLQQE